MSSTPADIAATRSPSADPERHGDRFVVTAALTGAVLLGGLI